MTLLHFTIALLVVAALAYLYVFTIRPWHNEWGAGHLDRVAILPGDELSPRAYRKITHAININAPPEAVWAWLIQIGQDRGGFYSYTWLENLLGCQMRNADRIVPEWQSRSVGETVWFATPKRYRGKAKMIVARADPPEALVLASPDDWPRIEAGDAGLDTTWTFYLRRKPDNTTRLIARLRAASFPGLWTRFTNYVFWEPAHFVMERKMLLTIKQRAEQSAAAPQPARL